MSAFMPGANWLVMTGSRVMASNVSGPTNRRADARHHRLHAMSALLQQPGDLDGLVGADAAGDAEADEGHDARLLGASSLGSRLTAPRATSCSARRAGFGDPSTLRHAAFEQLPRARGRHGHEFERVLRAVWGSG